MVLFGKNQTFFPPPNILPPKFLGWLRHCFSAFVNIFCDYAAENEIVTRQSVWFSS